MMYKGKHIANLIVLVNEKSDTHNQQDLQERLNNISTHVFVSDTNHYFTNSKGKVRVFYRVYTTYKEEEAPLINELYDLQIALIPVKRRYPYLEINRERIDREQLVADIKDKFFSEGLSNKGIAGVCDLILWSDNLKASFYLNDLQNALLDKLFIEGFNVHNPSITARNATLLYIVDNGEDFIANGISFFYKLIIPNGTEIELNKEKFVSVIKEVVECYKIYEVIITPYFKEGIEGTDENIRLLSHWDIAKEEYDRKLTVAN